jgi:hypothetical protein
MMRGRWPAPARCSSAAISRPVMFGISMSVSTTSGSVFAASASASRPSRARATTSMSDSISSSAASAPSTMPWSSAINTRMLITEC